MAVTIFYFFRKLTLNLLITGSAGFIGFHLTKSLGEKNQHSITAIDNINDYYDVNLKYGRLEELGFNRKDVENTGSGNFIVSKLSPNIKFAKIDICDDEQIKSLFSTNSFDIILHLAAQAGVRYSIVNPHIYISSNIQGFLNILEAARLFPPKHLVYASSSSVYGLNTKIPFCENDAVDKPASLYAATKRSNELMAHTYSHLYNMPTTGLRFFTVYGQWGRPDMAPFIFTKSIIENKPIKVFNNGNMKRDFTFIDDIIEGITRVMNLIPDKNNGVPASIYNIGNGNPVELMDFIHTLEKTLEKKAVIQHDSMKAGDMIETWADCSKLENAINFKPRTSLDFGIKEFAEWYKHYYK
jgi:UDP-glucuronate 4-epimerase